MKYKIVSSGSIGNAVIIEDMLFDCGVPFKDLREHLYNIKYLFITHTHSDHINKKTLEKIIKEFPRIVIIGNYDVARMVNINKMVGDHTKIQFKDRLIQSFLCPHDVPCHGFVVEIGNERLIYATDTTTLNHAPEGKFDYLFLESNHDENKIKAIQGKARQMYGYDAWENAHRHLSTQKSKAFYYIRRRSPESLWVELHKSGRFY